MSHFTVLVIGDDYEEQLAPYQENNMGDCAEEYMEFQDETDDVTTEYENGKTHMARNKTTGEVVSRYDGKTKIKSADGMILDSPDWEWIDLPTKEVFATLEDFVKEQYNYEKNEEGRYGYMTNPNSRWDWYAVGGRWSGFFKIKEDGEGELGHRSWGMEGVELDEKKQADIIRKGDVDFEAMMREAGDAAAKQWDEVNEAIKDTEPSLSWKECREKFNDDGAGLDSARDLYNSQPRVKAFKKTSIGQGWSADLDEITVPRQDYIDRMAASSIAPWAIVYDGEWVEKGEMGWFGMSSAEMSQDEWNSKVLALLMDLPDDTILTIVDCHV